MSSQSKKTGKKYKQVSNHSKKYKIGLGIVTYNRPDYLKQVLQGIINNILQEVDTVWIYDDGSTDDYSAVVENLPSKIKYHKADKNQGVAVAKNWVMNKLLEEGCYCIFISEDDIIPVDKKAIRGYIQASRNSGISHMMFAHHGPGNIDGPIFRSEHVSAYPSCVGAWSFFTRPGLFEVGLHDENFHNAYEHVELTWRHAKAGLTIPWGAYADATGSEKWIKEIPGSIDNSSIKKSDKWVINTYKSLEYWQTKDPDFPLKHTLENMKEQMAKDGVSVTTNKKKTR